LLTHELLGLTDQPGEWLARDLAAEVIDWGSGLPRGRADQPLDGRECLLDPGHSFVVSGVEPALCDDEPQCVLGGRHVAV